MQYIIIIILILCLSCVVFAEGKVYVDNKDITNNSIILISSNSSSSEKYAAEELQKYILELTKTNIPIKDSFRTTDFVLSVGKNTFSDKYVTQDDYNKLGSEGIIIKSFNNCIIFTGKKRGVLYSVYEFLDKYCGIKCLSVDCTYFSKEGNINVGKLDVNYVPPLTIRAVDYFSAFNQDWAARNRVNSYGYAKRSNIDDIHGGEFVYPTAAFFWHTIRQIVPVQTYGKTNPDFFSLIDGKRVTIGEEDTDYCVTNPEFQKKLIDGYRKVLRENPNAEILGVSGNDHHDRWCHCDKCLAIVNKYGAPSALMVTLLNKVASSLEGEFPNVRYTMLAYHWTQKPPKDIKVHPKVIIEVCPLNANQARPFNENTSDYDKKLLSDVKGWGDITNKGQIKFCQYSINYSNLFTAHPNLYVYQPNMEKMISLGAGHFYDCGSYTTRISDFDDLRAYLISKLAWNVNQNTDDLIDEFLVGYYGKASVPIKEYIKLIHNYVKSNPNMYFDCYSLADFGYLKEEDIDKGDKLFDEAENLVKDDPILLDRVKAQHLTIIATKAYMESLRYNRVGDKLELKLANNPSQIDKFLSECKRYNVTRAADVTFQTPEEYAKIMLDRLKVTSIPVVDIENRFLKLSVVPYFGGRIWKALYKNNFDIMSACASNDKSEVAKYGYEENFGFANGNDIKFNLVKKDINSLVMKGVSKENVTITREIKLVDNKIEIKTSFTNDGNKDINVNYKSHPTFQVSNIKNLQIFANDKYKKISGETGTVDFNKNDLSNGLWKLIDKNLVVTQYFDKNKISNSFVWYYVPFSQMVTFELVFKPVTLGVGENINFEHYYKIEEK